MGNRSYCTKNVKYVKYIKRIKNFVKVMTTKKSSTKMSLTMVKRRRGSTMRKGEEQEREDHLRRSVYIRPYIYREGRSAHGGIHFGAIAYCSQAHFRQ